MRLSHLVGLLGITLVSSVGCRENDPAKLYVGAASNVQDALTQIVDSFTYHTGVDVALVFNSSGNITTQVEQGLPIDIFVSADMHYPTSLHQEGYTLQPPEVYCRGRLAIITSGADIYPSFEAMGQPDINKVAIANPKVAPYGQKAMIALKNAGVLNSVRDKLIYGTNISQAHQFVDSGASDIGITARALVDTLKDHWALIPDDLYGPLAQGIVMIRRDDQNEAAMSAFYDFMFSEVAIEVLDSYGYLTDTSL